VFHYKALAIISLIVLLILQVYLIIGITAKTKSNDLFKQKEAIRTEIKEIKHLKELTHEDSKSDAHVMELQTQYKEIEQRQDANYELLRTWNKIWLALLSKGEFQGKITEYQEIVYNARFVELEKSIQSQREQLDNIAQETSIRSQREQVDNLVQETSVQSPRENLNNAARGKIDQHEKLAELEEELQEKRIEREHDMARNRFFLNTLIFRICGCRPGKIYTSFALWPVRCNLLRVKDLIEGSAGSHLFSTDGNQLSVTYSDRSACGVDRQLVLYGEYSRLRPFRFCHIVFNRVQRRGVIFPDG